MFYTNLSVATQHNADVTGDSQDAEVPSSQIQSKPEHSDIPQISRPDKLSSISSLDCDKSFTCDTESSKQKESENSKNAQPRFAGQGEPQGIPQFCICGCPLGNPQVTCDSFDCDSTKLPENLSTDAHSTDHDSEKSIPENSKKSRCTVQQTSHYSPKLVGENSDIKFIDSSPDSLEGDCNRLPCDINFNSVPSIPSANDGNEAGASVSISAENAVVKDGENSYAQLQGHNGSVSGDSLTACQLQLPDPTHHQKDSTHPTFSQSEPVQDGSSTTSVDSSQIHSMEESENETDDNKILRLNSNQCSGSEDNSEIINLLTEASDEGSSEMSHSVEEKSELEVSEKSTESDLSRISALISEYSPEQDDADKERSQRMGNILASRQESVTSHRKARKMADSSNCSSTSVEYDWDRERYRKKKKI